MCSTRPSQPVTVFGRFTLFRESPRLIADGLTVKIGARALELLIALLDADGRAVGQAELAQRGWPGLAVDLNTVQAQISALRRALGGDRDLIVTVPGFGYRFAGGTQSASTVAALAADPAHAGHAAKPPGEVPAHDGASASSGPPAAAGAPLQLTPFVGRHAELSEVLGLVSITRAITLVGEPGIGKARVAREAARRLAPRFADGCVTVTLSTLTPEDGYANAFALALNVPPSSGRAALDRLLDAVRAQHVLLVVECSECDRAPAARTIDAMLASAPGVVVIATALQSLGMQSEETVALGPLRTPEQSAVAAALAPAYDALRLLFARIVALSIKRDRSRSGPRAPSGSVLLAAFDAGVVAQPAIDCAVSVTQWLGGVPLALELAATAIFRDLREGEALETAMARYAQTLAPSHISRVSLAVAPAARTAPLPAAFNLYLTRLTDRTRRQLLHLGIFTGEFSHCAAAGLLVACEPSQDGTPASDDARAETHLAELVDAGLVEQIERQPQWMLQIRRPLRRLLRDLLLESGEYDRTALALATGLPVRLHAHLKRGTQPAIDALDLSDLGDLRAALEWVTEAERIDLAVTLLESSAPLWALLSLEAEYLRRTRAVLARVEAVATPRRRDEMRLQAILARALPLARASVGEIMATWQSVYDLANMCADSAYREQALIGLIVCCTEAGETRRAAQLRARLDRLASEEASGSLAVAPDEAPIEPSADPGAENPAAPPAADRAKALRQA